MQEKEIQLRDFLLEQNKKPKNHFLKRKFSTEFW